ncbi:MAG: sulfotransferase [Acidimicrobiia bacterium]
MTQHDDLMDAARAETGLDDFGDDSFREGLEILVRSLRTEAHLNAVGELALPHQVQRLLSQRLQIEDWYRRHPDIDDEPIVAPLVGLGLPRTGSTALSFLLGEDPAARSLRRYESAEPCPPPSTVEGPDPRVARAEAEMEMQEQAFPRIGQLVPSTPTGPYECQDLMALDFKSQLFQAYAQIPTYSEWLVEADLTPTYEYERRTLKLLQWGTPAKPWRLKCPNHLLFLDHFDRAFPDARFVMTHRDPAEVIVSVADLYAEVGQMFSDDLDLRYIGRLNVEQWSVGMRRALAFRDAGNDDRFYDIDFRAMQQDPIAEVRGLYAWLGEPVSEEFETGMRRWWQENAETRATSVHPDPATFGIDLAAVRPLFADYVTRVAAWTTR